MPLGLPTSTAPLYDAVIAALTTDRTGPSHPRALPTDRLFALGKPQDVARGPRSSEVFAGSAARGRPVCWVAPIQIAPTDPQLQMTDRARYDATIEIRLWYYAHDVNSDAWRAVMAEVHRDVPLVGHAMTFPGALHEDPTGRRTGLDGGSLRADDGRWTVRAPTPLADPRVVQVTHVFRASLEMAAPFAP